MEKSSHFDLQQFEHVFEKLGEFFHLKIFFGLLFVFLSWSFNNEIEILGIILSLIILDTLTGTIFSLRNKWLQHKGLYKGHPDDVFSSRGIYRAPVKLIVFFLMILVSRLVDKVIPLHFASPIMDTFLVSTEGYSILENIAKLGYNVPTLIINKLKLLAGNKE